MKAVLDPSVLIGDDAPAEVDAAISVASITELHFGVSSPTMPTSGHGLLTVWSRWRRPSTHYR